MLFLYIYVNMYNIYNTIQNHKNMLNVHYHLGSFRFKLIRFIQQGCIKLIKSDRKDIYVVFLMCSHTVEN